MRLHFKFLRPEDRPSIRFWHLISVMLTRVYHKTHVRNRNPLPHKGAAILVCNHISGLDPVVLQAVSGRLIIWMMAKEYFDVKAMRWFYRTVEAIPVARSGRDSAATRAAFRALEDGRVLGIFPEGRIADDGELLPFHPGVAMIAIRAGVPVFPAYIDGTTRGKEMAAAVVGGSNDITLRFGPEVKFDRTNTSRDGLTNAIGEIRKAVETLRDAENQLRQSKLPAVS